MTALFSGESRKRQGGKMGRVTKGLRKCLDVMNMFIILHEVLVSLMCAHMSKLTKLYTLDICQLQ